MASCRCNVMCGGERYYMYSIQYTCDLCPFILICVSCDYNRLR